MSGLYVRLQITISLYITPIHYMAHQMNMKYKIVIIFDNVGNVEGLICELHDYIVSSPKIFREF